MLFFINTNYETTIWWSLRPYTLVPSSTLKSDISKTPLFNLATRTHMPARSFSRDSSFFASSNFFLYSSSRSSFSAKVELQEGCSRKFGERSVTKPWILYVEEYVLHKGLKYTKWKNIISKRTLDWSLDFKSIVSCCVHKVNVRALLCSEHILI